MSYEQRSTARASPFSQRDSRAHQSSIDAEKPRISDKDGEPSEVLWIGFPAKLRVDEFILRKAFAPFGEIDKINAFPGRTYAFVRFRNVMAASRAKETLQGKLFGNPRIHICFAKTSEDFRNDSDFGNLSGDLSRSSPGYILNESGDLSVTSFGRKSNVWARGDDEFEQRRFPELGYEVGMPGNVREQRISPSRDRIGHFREFSRRSAVDDDSFDLPEEPLLFHGAKKPKTSNFSPENELPEYPFTNPARANRVPYRSFRGFEPDSHEKNFDSKPFEGTIAKGRTPNYRAHCFPVGKKMGTNLPEFLDCTARTSLGMLAKHYYQSTSIWAVYFVPASDLDMVFYNEFMTYLEEKQHAAKVLKVPGRLSISGVVLRSEQPGSTYGGSFHQQEKKDPEFATLHRDTSALR
ncbi:hypothetical protein M9H77_21030 [Catharanthus roseus]|uniref:Uncharacterized protein n=1 Tax=Catharanthus roseus TaxID=4058 RepID=A0ACC0AL58_CATRO|nr:hypothetical protein M9H77_21030 [Catharanthus roseus]